MNGVTFKDLQLMLLGMRNSTMLLLQLTNYR